MREIIVEKVILNIGGTAEKLNKGYKLLEMLSGRKPIKVKVERKRIPAWGVRPGLEVGCMVTLREDLSAVIKRFLTAVENSLKKKQVADNHFSFGVKEYIEVPGTEYQRDIGIMGFDVTVVFKRKGKRISVRKKYKTSLPEKQTVTKEEIIKYMEDNFKTKFN